MASMYSTADFRKGLKIEYNDKPYVIVEFQHVNPGKGSAFVRTRLKNLETAQVLEITFKSGDKVNAPDLEMRNMQYLYKEGQNYTFMDVKTYDQFTITPEELGDVKNYIVENGTAFVTFYKQRPVSVEVDTFVELEIVDTPPNIRGDTSGGGGKPATLSTGLVIQVPFHINTGSIVKVDTRTASYVEKIK